MRKAHVAPAIAAIAAIVSVAPAFGAWHIDNTDQNTLTFDANVGTQGTADVTSVFNVETAPHNDNVARISERDEWGWNGGQEAALSSMSWHFTGSDTNQTMPFTADTNNNGETANRFDLFQLRRITNAVLPALPDGDRAFQFEGAWQDKKLTLQVRNNTGETINEWMLGLDTWFLDQQRNGGSLSFRYGSTFATDGTVDGTTTLAGLVGTTVSTNDGSSDNATWSSLNALSATVPLTVAPGDDFYVQIFYDQNGDGNSIAFDNLSVQAVTAVVPEPASLGLVAIASLLGLRRRRA